MTSKSNPADGEVLKDALLRRGVLSREERIKSAVKKQFLAREGSGHSILPHLTDQDLKELGISLGHRRKLLASISQLGGEVKAMPEADVRAKAEGSAEHRQVTVLFCDLVGSTALAGGLDPEASLTLRDRSMPKWVMRLPPAPYPNIF